MPGVSPGEEKEMIAKIQVWGRHGENVAGGSYEDMMEAEEEILPEVDP